MNRKPPALRAALITYLLIVVLGLGAAGAHALWSQSGTVTLATTAGHWSLPSVTVASPGTTVRGSLTLTAEASDAETGIRSVALQYLPPNGAWTTLCTRSAAPYSCPWNTQAGPDGTHGLRAVATANSGLSTTSATVQTVVANTFSVTLKDIAEAVRGTMGLEATLTNPGSTAYAVRVEYFREGDTKWNTLCQMPSAPYTCVWPTGSFANDTYDLRAVAVSGGISTYSETVTDVLVDNQAPTVSMGKLANPLRGVVSFTATASDTDSGSGIAQVQIQYAPTKTTTWKELCMTSEVGEDSYSCRFNTLDIKSLSYDFRAVATDAAGNATTSTPVVTSTVDNTVSSVSLEDPGAYLSGTATLSAAANSTAGVGSVRIQSSPAGANTWTTRCTPVAAPYSCVWDTRTVADGLYDFRAVLTDGAGKETASAVVAGRRVDNIPLRATDIQAVNGGKVGKLDAGDTLAFTYNQQVNLASLTPGWTGAARSVTLQLRDGKLLGMSNNADTVDVLWQGSAVNLGSVNTRGNFVKNNKTVTFNATMTAATVTTAGVPTTVVTVTLGSPTPETAGNLRTVSAKVAMVWTPSPAVTSTTGDVCSVSPVTETGPIDRDF